MSRTRTALAVAVGSLLWFGYLALSGPTIDYGDFATECDSIASSRGDHLLLEVDGGPVDASVVRGKGAVDAARDEAQEEGVMDPFFVQRQLNADCGDRRTTRVGWSVVAGVLFCLGAVGSGGAVRRSLAEARASLVPEPPHHDYKNLP